MTSEIYVDKKYCLYIHTVPNGKVYIGITSQPPKRRWAYGGGYWHNEEFDKVIKAIGWNNIKHEIICDGLTKIEAEQKEYELIKKYKSDDPLYGYNMTAGETYRTNFNI